MYNKLAKQSYFIMRLRASGYNVERLYVEYSKTDSRMWTIIIDPKNANVLCTCYINNGENSDVSPKSKCFFEVFDGGQYIPGRLKIDTSSIEVFILRLMQMGIEPSGKSTPRKY